MHTGVVLKTYSNEKPSILQRSRNGVISFSFTAIIRKVNHFL